MNSSSDIQAWRHAVQAGDLVQMQAHLGRGIDPDAPLPDVGLTPLMVACSNGQAAAVQWLLAAGAHPDRARVPGQITPLMAAVIGGHEHTVRALCAGGASVDLLDDDGTTALGMAVASQHPAMVRILLEHGANPSLCANTARMPLTQAAANGDEEVARLLLDAGARVDPPGPSRHDSALVEAADGGHLELTRLLLARGARVDQQDINGNTPLMLAATMGHLAVVKLLLEHGANPNCADKNGNTAMHRVFELGKEDSEAIALALLPDLRLEQANKQGETALFAAVAGNNHRTIARLLDRGANIRHTNRKSATVLHEAVRGKDLMIVKLLLERGAAHDALDQKGRSALHLAAEYGALEIARELMGYCNLDWPNRWGATPIMTAASNGEDDVALMLMARGCRTDDRNDQGGLQHCAATGGAVRLLEALLVQQGADQSFNEAGRTPLHEAAANNQFRAGALLVRAGADPDKPTRDGRSLLDLGTSEFLHAIDQALAQRNALALQDATTPANAPTGRRRI